MPYRKEPFITDNYYHIYNKTIDSFKLFKNTNYCKLFLNLIKYYRSSKALLSYSRMRKFNKDAQNLLMEQINIVDYFRIEIFSYTLMPNHFHIQMKQKRSNGIEIFMSNIVNALTKHYNIKNGRDGPIFLPRFKSVRIKSDEQFLHVSRYIHLNPYSSGLVKSYSELIKYPWSSFKAYVEPYQDKILNTKYLLGFFNNDRNKLKKFVLQQAEYQKKLEIIKKRDNKVSKQFQPPTFNPRR